MAAKTNPIHQKVEDALRQDRALRLEEIMALRKKSRETIKALKITFWAAIILLNVVLWVPLPFDPGTAATVTISVLCLLVAFIPPIFGIRAHQRRLELLAESSSGPRGGKLGAAGKNYIDRVKEEGRLFIRAEVEILEGRKGADRSSAAEG